MPSITFSIGGPSIDISNKSSDQVLDIIKKEYNKEKSKKPKFKVIKKAEMEKETPNSTITYETEKESLHKKTIERLMGLGKNSDYWFKKSVIEERYRGDKKKLREIKKLHKTIFEEYKNEYGALLDKYNYSKSCYRQKAKSNLYYINILAYKKFPPNPYINQKL